MFKDISDCDDYLMTLDDCKRKTNDNMYEVTFYVPYRKQHRTVMVKDQLLPGNVTIGNFKDIWWGLR